MIKPLFLVLAGDGINCERETACAFELAGGNAHIMHINDLLETPEMLNRYDGLALPGGFSFGDELGSGQIMALKLRHGLGESFFEFVNAQKPVIGICNGFQVLVKLGLLPNPKTLERTVALAANQQGGFINRWVTVKVEKNTVCQWTRDLAFIDMPIRHGEGRIVLKDDNTFQSLQKNGQIAMTYLEDVNGSYERIAALCDETGMVLGLMPHPEAHVYSATYKTPVKNYMQPGQGLRIFENIVNVLTGRESEKIYAGQKN